MFNLSCGITQDACVRQCPFPYAFLDIEWGYSLVVLCRRRSQSKRFVWEVSVEVAETKQDSSSQRTLIADFVQQVNHYVDLVDGCVVEVLSDSHCELFFGYFSLALATRHGGRLSANTRIGEQELVPYRLECRWRFHVMGGAVLL